MKQNLLVLAVMVAAVLFFIPHNAGAQCPEDENDLGICDTIYVETFDCDHIYEAEPGSFDSVRVAVYVTHDSNTFWWEGGGRWVQDSIACFVIPLTFWHEPEGCADSVILPNWDNWNNTSIIPGHPLMNRSMFRHIVDTHTGDTTCNRMLQMVENGEEAWHVVTDIESHSSDGDSGHMFLAVIRVGANCQCWWEGSRALLATLTFQVYMGDECLSTAICLDSTFWPPNSRLAFTRYDAKNYSPRHFLPVKDTIYLPINQPPQLTCPDQETQHTNGTFTTTTKWYASDPESGLVMPPTCQAPGGPIPTCSVNVDSSTGQFAEGTITYSVTDHGQVGTYYIMLTVMDDQGMADTCFLPITLDNHPPVLDAIGNHKFNEGDYIVLNVSAFDLDGDSLIFTASNLPEGAYFDGEYGVFLWTPTYTEYGTYPNIHFEVSDDQGGTDAEDITIEILNYPQCDVTGDGIVNIADVMYLINYLFIEGPPPEPLEAGDATCDGVVNIADALHLINYLFVDGPAPCRPPTPKFTLPKSNGLVNGLVWVSVQNLSDTPVQAVEFEYSADSLIWNELVFDEREPPWLCDLTGRIYRGSWNTDSLASGQYWVRVIMSDTIHGLQEIETIPVIINKNPNPLYSVSYDSLTEMVTFDGSPSSDTDGTVIWYSWIFCDSTVMHGQVVQKEFQPGDSCQVNLTIFDNHYNSAIDYGLMVVYQEGTAEREDVEKCECISIKIDTSGEIPAQYNKLHWGQIEGGNPTGNRHLGPVDHLVRDRQDEFIKDRIRLYFMVEIEVKGNAQLCSTLQKAAGTYLYDGKEDNAGQPGYGPNGELCGHKKEDDTQYPYDPRPGFKCNPENRPNKRDDLGPDDYFSSCGPGPIVPECPYQKIQSAPNGGKIAFLDGPGLPDMKDSDFIPAGVKFCAFYLTKVLDYPGHRPCSGGCEQCFKFLFKYDKDKNRQDVDGDPEHKPDPPMIILDDCPDK